LTDSSGNSITFVKGSSITSKSESDPIRIP